MRRPLAAIAACLLGFLGITASAAHADTPSLPDGLNVAIGAPVHANAAAAPGSTVRAVVDGDGTTRYCPATLGVHRVTVDLGRAVDVTGTGATFSGEEGADGSTYTVSTGVARPGERPLGPATGDGIVQGPLYRFAGAAAGDTVRARYVTISWRVPREQDICLHELRVFSTDAVARPRLALGGELTDGTSAVALSRLRDGGVNELRLPLLVQPSGCATACPDLGHDLRLARRARRLGMRVALELDYSDAPVSSTAQATPAAWRGLTPRALRRRVRRYTRDALAAFAAQGTPVARVALGGPLTQGILWPSGRVVVGAAGRTRLGGLPALLRAAIAGVRSRGAHAPRTAIELDADTAADPAATVDLFGALRAAGIRPDVIGLDYEPWLQGPMTSLRATLSTVVRRLRTPVVLTGTGFPSGDISGYGSWTDDVPYPATLPGYLLTAPGQASYERDLVSLVAALPGRLGRGVEYRAPDAAAPLGWFSADADAAAQPALDAFRVGSGATLYRRSAPYVTGDGSSAPPPGGPPADQGPAATLPVAPAGLNVAIGAPVATDAGTAAATKLTAVDDGDGTSRWCPGRVGTERVTLDLGRVRELSGTGITFSGQHPGDGTTYAVTVGTGAPGATPLGGGATAIDGTGEQDRLAGATPDATIAARYVTLTVHVARAQSVCVQELRTFAPGAPAAAGLQRGADLSTLLQDTGTFTLNGAPTPILDIFRAGGLNYVRLRLWVDPLTGNFGDPPVDLGCSAQTCPDLANDLTIAREAQARGFKVLLDLHYSDVWADPGHQNVPKAWLGQTLPQLAASVRSYTRSAVRAFAAQGTPVAQVAVGNEITQGLLWQYTRLAAADGAVTPAGARTIEVQRAAGIRPGDTLYVDTEATGNSIAGVPGDMTDVVRVASVHGDTVTLVAPLRHDHTGPVVVQEPDAGGHLLFGGPRDTADWGPLETLLRAGIAGVHAGAAGGAQPLVQLHLDRGGDNAAATDFVAHMRAAGVHFDVLGLSYYPWYHGPMSAMRANVEDLVRRFGLRVEIAEDQLPQRPQQGYGIDVPAYSNFPDPLPGYAITPQGQAGYQRDLLSLMASLPGRHGLGAFYWDADALGYLGQFTVAGAAQPIVFSSDLG